MFKSDQITIPNKINVISRIPWWRRLIVSLDEPSIIWISDKQHRYLLLSCPNRVQLAMRMQVLSVYNGLKKYRYNFNDDF